MNKTDEIKELLKEMEHLESYEINLNTRFRKFAKPCECRKTRYRGGLDNCTNEEHPWRSKVCNMSCHFSLCPLLKQ